jgi:HEAT repeat protein
VALLCEVITDKAAPHRKAALRALWEFEADAASAIPLLMQLLDDSDPQMRGSAAHCLARIGPEAIVAGAKLAELAQYGSDDEKRSAFYALEQTGYDPMIMAQICYEAIQFGSEEARSAALSALEKADGDPAPVAEYILKVFEEKDGDWVKSTTFKLLERCEFTDEGFRQRAIQALQTYVIKNPPHSRNAVSCLWRIDPGNALVYARVELGLKSDDSDMEAACDVIYEMGPRGAKFVPLLLEQLEKRWEYWDFCWAAVDALAAIGTEARGAEQMLHKLREHPSDLVKERAENALREIGC